MSYHRIKKKVGDYILAKFKHECVKCGSKEDLCVHHVVKMKPDNPEYNDTENLTVLCRSCHMKHHRKEGDIKPPFPPSGNSYGRRGKKPPIKCKEEGCDRLQHARSLCKKHYECRRRKGILY